MRHLHLTLTQCRDPMLNTNFFEVWFAEAEQNIFAAATSKAAVTSELLKISFWSTAVVSLSN